MKYFSQAKTLFSPSNATRTLQVVLAAVAMGAVVSLRAEPPAAAQGAPAAQSEQMQAARQLHGEYMQLQQRLGMIQQKAMQAHPELQKQEQDLQALMMSKMSDAGVNAKEEMAAIGEIEQKLRNQDTPDSERQALFPEYEKRVKAFREAQMQAMQDPQVQQGQAELVKATTAAMKEEDPQTEQLIQQLEQKQAELQKLMESGRPAQ